MFNDELPGGVINGIYYLERIIALIRNLFAMLFGGNTSDTTTAAETTTESSTAE